MCVCSVGRDADRPWTERRLSDNPRARARFNLVLIFSFSRAGPREGGCLGGCISRKCRARRVFCRPSGRRVRSWVCMRPGAPQCQVQISVIGRAAQILERDSGQYTIDELCAFANSRPESPLTRFNFLQWCSLMIFVCIISLKH
jgi:hypothetical protein